MNPDSALAHRLQFLARVLRKESQHLSATDQRLFVNGFTVEHVARLETDPDLAERVEAFVGRFGRLQDSIGDKLLPALLTALGEKPSALIDNLDRAERLGFIHSAEQWLTMRQLRNQMIHEYIEDPAVLTDALQAGHDFVPILTATAQRIIVEMEHRAWI